MAAAHLTNTSMESSQGMSDIAMDACMRSFDLAMVKAKYLTDIKRDVEDAEDGISTGPMVAVLQVALIAQHAKSLLYETLRTTNLTLY